MYDTGFVEWYYSFEDRFKVIMKAIIIIFASLTLIVHWDLLALFITLSVLLSITLSHWLSESVILPSVLIAMGIVFNIGIYLTQPQTTNINPVYFKIVSHILATVFVLPPALYIMRKYYELKDKPFLPVTQIVSIGLLMLGIGVLLLFPIIPYPSNYIVCLGWGSIITITLCYTLIKYAIGQYWSTAIYHGDYVDEAKDVVIELLDSINAKYIINSRRFPTVRYVFKILTPFKGKIIIRRWVHRAIIRGNKFGASIPVGEPGLIIEVSPEPKNAPSQLRRIVTELLKYFNLSTVDWEQETTSS